MSKKKKKKKFSRTQRELRRQADMLSKLEKAWDLQWPEEHEPHENNGFEKDLQLLFQSTVAGEIAHNLISASLCRVRNCKVRINFRTELEALASRYAPLDDDMGKYFKAMASTNEDCAPIDQVATQANFVIHRLRRAMPWQEASARLHWLGYFPTTARDLLCVRGTIEDAIGSTFSLGSVYMELCFGITEDDQLTYGGILKKGSMILSINNE